MKTTIRQKAFIQAITNIADKTTFGNGVESARYAGYKGNGDTLKVTASRLLTYDNVKAEIGQIEAKRQAEMGYDQQKAYELLFAQHKKADARNDVMAAVACIRELDKVAGLVKEHGAGVASAQPPPLSPEQAEQLKRMAASLTDRQQPGKTVKIG